MAEEFKAKIQFYRVNTIRSSLIIQPLIPAPFNSSHPLKPKMTIKSDDAPVQY